MRVPCLLSGAAPAASAAIGIKPAAQLRLPFGRVAGVGPLRMLAPVGLIVVMGIRVVAVDIGAVGPPSKFAWAEFEAPGREVLAAGHDP